MTAPTPAADKALLDRAMEKMIVPEEGDIPHMYCDWYGYVTVGIGTMLESADAAVDPALPFFRRSDGAKATAPEVREDWGKARRYFIEWMRTRLADRDFMRRDGKLLSAEDVEKDWTRIQGAYVAWTKTKDGKKALTKLGKEKKGPPGAGAYAGSVTSLHIPDEHKDARRKKALTHLRGNLATLRQRFAEWDTFPEPAKIALLDMLYNLGTANLFGSRKKKGYSEHFIPLVRQRKWSEAAKHSKRSGPPPRRNKKTRDLLDEAQKEEDAWKNQPPAKPAPERALTSAGGLAYITEAAQLQCVVCQGKVQVKGKGMKSWKIDGRPVLTAEGLKGAPVVGCRPPPAGGLGCTQIKEVVFGKARSATAGGKTPLLAPMMAITDKGGLVMVVSPPPPKAHTTAPADPAAHAANSEAAPEKPHKAAPDQPGQLKFRLLDPDNKPVPDEWYRVTLPGGAVADGLLDDQGRACVMGFDPGICSLAFPGLRFAHWEPAGDPTGASEAYTARKGDTLSGVARKFQLPGWQTLWNYPPNAKLRRDRKSPDVLRVGDVIQVPLRDRRLASRDAEYELRLKQPVPRHMAIFRLVDDLSGAPLPNVVVLLEGPDKVPVEATSGPHGEIVLSGEPKEQFTLLRVKRPHFLGVGDPEWLAPASHGASLDGRLTETMLAAAAPDADRAAFAARNDAPGPVPPADVRPGAADADVDARPTWDFAFPPGEVNRITGLTCALWRHAGHPGPGGPLRATVCTEVVWARIPVAVQLPGGERLDLPLDPAHLTRHQRLTGGGHCPAKAHRLWPLESNVDIGFQNVFAYRVDDDGSGRPRVSPCPPAECGNDRFMHRLAPPERRPVAKVGAAPLDVPIVRLRVAVVTSLVCCKPRANFEPGEVLLAARLFPLLMLSTTLPLQSAITSVEVTRPDTSSLEHPGLRRDIRAGLYIDSNRPLFASLPGVGKVPLVKQLDTLSWGTLFSYYKLDNVAGTYLVVHRRQGPGLELGWGNSRAVRRPATVRLGVSADALEKWPGQGAFDNIHIAPPMFLSPPPSPQSLPKDDVPPFNASFDAIIMAPFCAHDCLHTHWRWGPMTANQEQCGWSADGRPYSEPGAPLVPVNQDVEIAVAGTGFTYTAGMTDVPAAEWQVVMHHGSAYAVAEADPVFLKKLRGMLEMMRVALGEWGLPNTDWPTFYWRLRYAFIRPIVDPETGRLLTTASAFLERNPVPSDATFLGEAMLG
jgi:hypothetical protein